MAPLLLGPLSSRRAKAPEPETVHQHDAPSAATMLPGAHPLNYAKIAAPEARTTSYDTFRVGLISSTLGAAPLGFPHGQRIRRYRQGAGATNAAPSDPASWLGHCSSASASTRIYAIAMTASAPAGPLSLFSRMLGIAPASSGQGRADSRARADGRRRCCAGRAHPHRHVTGASPTHGWRGGGVASRRAAGRRASSRSHRSDEPGDGTQRGHAFRRRWGVAPRVVGRVGSCAGMPAQRIRDGEKTTWPGWRCWLSIPATLLAPAGGLELAGRERRHAQHRAGQRHQVRQVLAARLERAPSGARRCPRSTTLAFRAPRSGRQCAGGRTRPRRGRACPP